MLLTSRRRCLSCLTAFSVVASVGGCSSQFGLDRVSSEKAGRPRIGKAAILAPMTGRYSHLGKVIATVAEVGGHLNGGEMSLFDSGDTVASATASAEQAVANGARMIVGPLFSEQSAAIAEKIGRKIPILSLSNDSRLVDQGVFVMGLTPFQSVNSVMSFAVRRGLKRIGVVAAANQIGIRSTEIAKNLAKTLGVEIFEPIIGVEPDDAISRLKSVANGTLPDGVLIPSVDENSERIATTLQGDVQVLGSVQWSGWHATENPGLQGAWYPAPDPIAFEPFAVAYEEGTGSVAGILAGIVFDAVEMARLLGRIGEQDRKGLTRQKGFDGVIGPYKFEKSGECRRTLAIVQVEAGSLSMIGSASV